MKENCENWEIDLVPSWGLPGATRCAGAETNPEFVIRQSS